MSSNAARYYDDIYAANGKDYRAEADVIRGLFGQKPLGVK